MFIDIFGQGLKRKALLYRELFTLVKSGVALQTSIGRSASYVKDRSLRKIYFSIGEGLRRGMPLAKSMESLPELFSGFEIGLVKSGEASGKLDRCLDRLAVYFEKLYDQRIKIVSGLIYPVFVLHCGLILPNLGVLFLKGLPEFLNIVVSSLLKLYGFFILVYLIKKYLLTGYLENIYAGILNGLPYFGNLVSRLAVARFILAFQNLYTAGVNVVSAWETGMAACGNSSVENKLRRGAGFLRTRSIIDAFTATGLFSDSVLGMINTGELSGNMDDMLGKIGEYYEKENDETLKRFSSLFPFVIYAVIVLYIGYTISTQILGIFSGISIPDF